MEIQAGTELFPEDGFRSNVQVAGAQRVLLPEEIHQVPRMHHGTIGAEIPVSLPLFNAPGNEHFGEFIARHTNPGIGLGVLQEDVVAGFVLLDEVVFQQEGIGFTVHHGIRGIGNFRHQDAGFRVQTLRRHKILRHPLVKVFRLSYIDNLSLGVIVSVDTGGMGKKGYFFSDCHPEAEGRRIYSASTSATFWPIRSPRRPRATMVPSGPKRMMCGMPSMP